MRVKLRISNSARSAIVPPPISGREVNGDPRPLAGTGPNAQGYEAVTTIPAVHATQNIGRYIPPPKNPIWTPIPVGIKPTKPCAKC